MKASEFIVAVALVAVLLFAGLAWGWRVLRRRASRSPEEPILWI